MCGRYALFNDAQNKEIMEILRQVQGKIKVGEIYPTNPAPVLLADGVHVLHWGFPNFKNKGVIINARAETAAEKRMFKNCVATRRCVIPSTGFYEWQSKQKYHFTLPGNSVLYMAGLYSAFADEEKFVIVTTAANASVSSIHDRMPLVLEKDAARAWIENDTAAMRILHGAAPMLAHDIVSEGQLTLPI